MKKLLLITLLTLGATQAMAMTYAQCLAQNKALAETGSDVRLACYPDEIAPLSGETIVPLSGETIIPIS